MLNKDLSSLQCSFLRHKFRLWKLFKKLLKHFLRYTEEESPILFCCAQGVVFLASNLHDKIGPKIKHQLVLAEEGKARELQKRCYALLIVENSGASCDEIHFIHFLPVGDDCFAWLVNPAVHVNNQLMLETNIRIQKEITKLVFETLKK
jgi:hypothetical protein